MPLKGYVCPPGGEKPGRANAVEYCLSECVRPCVTPPLLAAMWKSDTENYHSGDYISASMLAGTNCMRQTFLERFHDFHDVPTKRYWPFRGTHAHKIVEEAADILAPYGWLQEIRMSTTLVYPDLPAPRYTETGEFDGTFDFDKPLQVVVRGTCDAYNPFRRDLVDCKSMADTKVEMMIEGSSPGTYSRNLQDNWITQLNIYRWLISHTPIPDHVRDALLAHGLPALPEGNYPAPERLYIQGIAMMSHPVSGSKHAHKIKGKGVKVYEIDAVPVWTLEDIEAYVRPLALKWYKALNMRRMPKAVTEDRKWMCKSCAFYGSPCQPEKEWAKR
jgi:hypothetical protein